jgi:hypothetical protein
MPPSTARAAWSPRGWYVHPSVQGCRAHSASFPRNQLHSAPALEAPVGSRMPGLAELLRQ